MSPPPHLTLRMMHSFATCLLIVGTSTITRYSSIFYICAHSLHVYVQCGHCKSAKPQFAEAARELKKQKSKWLICGIDANGALGRKTGAKYGVKGYPSIKYFDGGVLKYEADHVRTKDQIMAFVAKPSLPPPPPPPDKKWSDIDTDVTHLTSASFQPTLAAASSALVMVSPSPYTMFIVVYGMMIMLCACR